MPTLAGDEYWMARAIRLAENGRYSAHPNPRVGCVVIKNNQLVSEGWHRKTGEGHAEVNAIDGAEIPPGCTVYVTLEPCSHSGRTPPCTDKLMSIKPQRVVIAMVDPNPQVSGNGIAKLEANGISVECGLMEASARRLNPGFIKRMETGIPFVRLKLAMSLDGKTALKNGESQWITGQAARRDVQYLRAQSSAILSTAESVIRDQARLNVRLTAEDLHQDIAVRQPDRVILDRQYRLQGTEALFDLPGKIYLCGGSPRTEDISSRFKSNVDRLNVELNEQGQLDLKSVFKELAKREINEVFCEVGATLSGSLIRQRLVDELIIYMAPKILGHDAQSLMQFDELQSIDDSIQCTVKDIRQIGDDIRMTYIPRIP